jgi:hypothetical protein
VEGPEVEILCLRAKLKDAAGEIEQLKQIIEGKNRFVASLEVETMGRLREKDEVISSLHESLFEYIKSLMAVQDEMDEILLNN